MIMNVTINEFKKIRNLDIFNKIIMFDDIYVFPKFEFMKNIFFQNQYIN